MSPNRMVVLTVMLHAATVGMALFIGIFYFAPDKIVFGVQASVLLGIALSLYNVVAPKLGRVLGWRNRYLRALVRHPQPIFAASCAVVAAAALWIAVMFGTIVARYKYLDAIDHAISVIGSNQLALPAPEDLATAFNLMPQRPEVPFILMRAARLLSFDDRPENYYAYVKVFNAKVDSEGIATRFSQFHRPAKFSIDTSTPTLPLLDPIQVLSEFGVESDDPAAGLEWAVELLRKYRNRDEDAELKLWRTLLETELVLSHATDAQTIGRARRDAIEKIRGQIEPQNEKADFRALSFAADHVYQEALDYLAWLYAGGPEADAELAVPCEDANLVVPTFQRVLLLRSKLMNQSDLLWWQSPGKLNLYLLYLHFGGQKGTISAIIYDNFAKCPGVMDKITELHSAIAFKQFQEPGTWLAGTPLSPGFNGSSSIALLRQWIRLGW